MERLAGTRRGPPAAPPAVQRPATPPARRLADRHVVLIGLSGSGKSTVGRLLSERLGLPFFDTDALIEEEAGQPIPRIFAEQGETAFRELERRAVAYALHRPPAVIATGGGAPVDPHTRAALLREAFVVWLDAPVDVLVARVGETGAGRPLLAAGGPAVRLATLRAAREPVYAEAHARVDTSGGTAENVAARIISLLEEAT